MRLIKHIVDLKKLQQENTQLKNENRKLKDELLTVKYRLDYLKREFLNSY